MHLIGSTVATAASGAGFLAAIHGEVVIGPAISGGCLLANTLLTAYLRRRGRDDER